MRTRVRESLCECTRGWGTSTAECEIWLFKQLEKTGMSRLTGNLFCGALLVSSFLVTPVLWTQEEPKKGPEQVDDLFKKVDLKSQDETKVFGQKVDKAAETVVNRYLEAVGGRAVLASVKDRMAKFRNIKYSATGETEAVIALYLKRGHKYREEWEIKGFKIKDEKLAFTQVYDGEKQEGWVQMLGTVSPLEGRTLSVFVWDKQVDDFFLHWQEDGYGLKMIGQGLVDDEAADIVEVADFTGRQKIRYFFSKKTALLLKKEWFDTSGKQTVKKEQFYKLYRAIKFKDNSRQAVKFPLKLEIHVDGDLDTKREYTDIQFNQDLKDALFAKPEGVPFTGGIDGTKKKPALPTATKVGPAPPVGVHAGRGRSRGRSRTSRKGAPGGPKPAPVEPAPVKPGSKVP